MSLAVLIVILLTDTLARRVATRPIVWLTSDIAVGGITVIGAFVLFHESLIPEAVALAVQFLARAPLSLQRLLTARRLL